MGGKFCCRSGLRTREDYRHGGRRRELELRWEAASVSCHWLLTATRGKWLLLADVTGVHGSALVHSQVDARRVRVGVSVEVGSGGRQTWRRVIRCPGARICRGEKQIYQKSRSIDYGGESFRRIIKEGGARFRNHRMG